MRSLQEFWWNQPKTLLTSCADYGYRIPCRYSTAWLSSRRAAQVVYACHCSPQSETAGGEVDGGEPLAPPLKVASREMR